MSLFELHQVEFPNLGWKFTISRGFTIFGFDIYWYGVVIAIGVLLAIAYGLKRAESFGIDPDSMIDVALYTIPVAFLGARLYYVLFEDLDAYLANPISILDLRDGGLGIYGGIIVAFLFGSLMCKLKKVKIWAMFDLASLGFLIGQGMGRWGNFFNQEAFGSNTNLPWAMTGDIIRSGQNGSDYVLSEPVHPTFFYEFLLCVTGFILLHLLSTRLIRRFDGMIFCGYIVWYGTGRLFIEGLRTDSLMLGFMRISQLVAVIAILLGVILFFVLRRYAISLPKTLVIAVKDDIEDEEAAIEHSETIDDTPATIEEEPHGTAD